MDEKGVMNDPSPDCALPTGQPKEHPGKLVRVAIIAGLLVFMSVVILNRDKLEVSQFRALGYPGVFLLALIGSATVLLPLPHLAFTFTMGAVLNPWLIGLAAGVGDTLGEFTGYLAGYAVEGTVNKSRLYQTLERWMRHNGDLTIFVLSALPMPFFDLAAMAGGVVGYPLKRFVLATLVGKTLKALWVAWAGYFGVAWAARWLGVE